MEANTSFAKLKNLRKLAFGKGLIKNSLSLVALIFSTIMKKSLYTLSFIGFLALSIGFLQSCKNKDPSFAKVYVRSENDQLVEGAKVVIIGDVDNATTTVSYVDTVLTNSSGFAQFNMDEYFAAAGEDNPVGVFDVIIKKGLKYGEAAGFRVRIHNTSVKTVTFQP
jgi:hypothetical protein